MRNKVKASDFSAVWCYFLYDYVIMHINWSQSSFYAPLPPPLLTPSCKCCENHTRRLPLPRPLLLLCAIGKITFLHCWYVALSFKEKIISFLNILVVCVLLLLFMFYNLVFSVAICDSFWMYSHFVSVITGFYCFGMRDICLFTCLYVC